MARKKDERFRFRNFSIFYFQRAKNREDEYHNDASKIQIQKPFSVSKAEGKNKNTKDLDIAISSSFFQRAKKQLRIQDSEAILVSYFLMRRHAAMA